MEIKITPKKNNDTTKTKSSIYQYENVNAFLEDLLCLNWAQGSLIRDEYKAEIKRFHEDCYLVLDEEKVGLFTQIRHLLESKGFRRQAVSVPSLADNNGESAVFVTGSNNAVLCKYDKGNCTLDFFLSVAYTINEVILLRYKCAYKVAGIDISAAHCFKVRTAVLQELLCKLLGITDNTN